MRFLLFSLYGPMAAWGEAAPGEVRPTNLHPTRSALLGLLAAALGLDRRDEEAHGALAADLRFAVRVASAGVPVVDYHTAQLRKPRARFRPETRSQQLDEARHELMTVLSRRDYRCDALADVAVWSEAAAPRFGLAELAEALRRPVFTLYLGRKACPPALPLAPHLVEAPTLAAAFAAEPGPEVALLAPARLAGRDLGGAVGLFWESSEGVAPGVEAEQAFERRDDPLSRTRRTFRTRWEHYAPLPDRPEEEASDGAEPLDPGP